MRILHVATDDKFIDHAFDLFEAAFPKQNDVLIISKSFNLKYVKLVPKKLSLVRFSIKRRPKVRRSFYENYDAVFFHSLDDLIYPEVYNIPEHLPKIWLGWGYDYYELIGTSSELLLPKTRLLIDELRKNNTLRIVGASFGRALLALGFSKSREKAIEKISLFSPVLPNEYELVRKARKWQDFPRSASWNYGTIEDNLIRGFERHQVSGDAILVGNSASPNCNHAEAFDFLLAQNLKNRKFIVPLSYGNKLYARKVIESGECYFGVDFVPLQEFLPIKDYVAMIKKCGYVIMNHRRQQAVGNIVIMLYLGARVFVREENLVYTFFKKLGVSLSTVQELEVNPGLLNLPLSDEERETNRKAVSVYWSRERGIERTNILVEQAVGNIS
ncbi:hypothetical protein RE428_17990 [Marinobacter nanhaiticus D15-8W]|uniref:4-alpha-L-fucosyltransferase (Fuc4NAc transferase) n=1 Tax=Marinobacter nanhaiticus D15-8W TaxID=626887 RepID=N6VZT6_9GAMM|nr:TDP-N-acetylfucosamine:lipid II N-acetylfucosaminyltransferase [Marinobacter nanhaiticus]ENO13414.1 4-alpha-L-fucosyltransferase (Fuc4NAc transferase) [Marinobacter nanhaiticus D15-8W]BES70781.1 hypothetical protein RE428_17990 [Marinobacter nanhaiticus D15-8W]